MFTEAEVRESVVELRQLWRPWIVKCQDWRRLVQTQRRVPEAISKLTGEVKADIELARQHFSQYVSARLALIHRSAIGRVINGEININAAVMGKDDAAREQQIRLTRVAHGFIKEQDQNYARYARGTSWHRRCAVNAFVDGEIVGRVQVLPSPYEAGLLSVDWTLFDPISCYFDFDTWPRRFVREFRTGRRNARAIIQALGWTPPAGVDWTDEASIPVQEFWLEEKEPDGTYTVSMGVSVDETMAAPRLAGLERTNFKRLPIIISCAHAEDGAAEAYPTFMTTPFSKRGVTYDRVLFHAQSFYSPVEHIHRIFDEWMSLGMEGLAYGLLKMRYVHSPGAKFVPDASRIGPGAVVPLDSAKGEKIEADTATVQGIPEALTVMRSIVDDEINRLYNPALLGDDSPGESGFHFNNRVGHAKSVIHEPVQCISNFYYQGIIEALEQWRDHGELRTRMEGKAASGTSMGHLVLEEYSISDLPKTGSFALEVSVAPDIPVDDMVQLNYVLQATNDRPGVGPVMDLEAGRQSLGIEDYQAVQQRIEEEKLRSSPEAQQERVLGAMWAEADRLDQMAQREPDRVKQLRLRRAAARAQLRAQAYDAQLTGATQQAANQASQPGGFNPMALPPEATTENPDMAATAEGRPNAYMGGPPGGGNGRGEGQPIPAR